MVHGARCRVILLTAGAPPGRREGGGGRVGGGVGGQHISNFGTVNEDKGGAGDREGGSILMTDR